MVTVFVEQPLALPGSVKYKKNKSVNCVNQAEEKGVDN